MNKETKDVVVRANLDITITVTCPHCTEYLDYKRLNGDWHEVLPNGAWCDGVPDLDEEYICTNCGETFIIESY